MAKLLSDILKAAAQVRDEKTPGANTAERVGGVLTDIVNRITEYPGLNSDQAIKLDELSFISFYDVGEIEPYRAVEKVLREGELGPFMIIHGFYPDGESPYLIIANSKGIYDGVEWEQSEGSDYRCLPCFGLVLEANRIYVNRWTIAKDGEIEPVYIDECATYVVIYDDTREKEYNIDLLEISERLLAVEKKLKELTASTQA